MKRARNPEGFGRVMEAIAHHIPWPVAAVIVVLALALALPWLTAEAVRGAYFDGRFDAALPAWVKTRRDDKVWAEWDGFTRRFARCADPERWSGRAIEDMEDEG